MCNDKKEYILSKQVLRSGTSIGANIKEGIQAQSRKDFLNKMNIALKEASETDYWLELLIETKYIDTDASKYILAECKELNKMLASIVKTTKQNIRTVENWELRIENWELGAGSISAWVFHANLKLNKLKIFRLKEKNHPLTLHFPLSILN